MPSVGVNLGPRSYEIVIGTEHWKGLGRFTRICLPASYRALIVCDTHTQQFSSAIQSSLAGSGFRLATIVVPAGESSKSFAQLSRIYDALYDLAADRKSCVVAVGGGVVGDLAGFAAATYNRGLPLLMVPTSLLAMVDSSVGGKTGINHPRGKNLIGSFHQPAGVWINPASLDSLPEREFRSGLAEVVKYGVILDAPFFEWLENQASAVLAREPDALVHVITRCCQLKASVVERDELEETGVRAVLNYGHTFAHAFETVAGYGSWLHGEAVAAGMVLAARLASRLGLLEGNLQDRQQRLLERFALPTAREMSWPVENLIEVMKRDKKATVGRMRFVLPTRIGEVKLVEDVPESAVRDVLESP